MAVMSDPDRVLVWADWMRENIIACGFNKTALKAAVDAADQWASDNAASYNSALPTTFRNNATNAQKAMLLMLVIMKRHGLGL